MMWDFPCPNLFHHDDDAPVHKPGSMIAGMEVLWCPAQSPDPTAHITVETLENTVLRRVELIISAKGDFIWNEMLKKQTLVCTYRLIQPMLRNPACRVMNTAWTGRLPSTKPQAKMVKLVDHLEFLLYMLSVN